MVEDLLAELRAHPASDGREAAMRDRIVAFIERHDDAFERTQLAGHVTASAWIVDPARTHALLLHHRTLDRWLQPGGHVDGDPDVRAAAMREAREETGLRRLRFASDAVYDLGSRRRARARALRRAVRPRSRPTRTAARQWRVA
jgi:8-oxo-dGTP pyrophosphatase MutT (NUDIX family)